MTTSAVYKTFTEGNKLSNCLNKNTKDALVQC